MNLDLKLSMQIDKALKDGVTEEELFKHFKIKSKQVKHKEAPFNFLKIFWIFSLIVVLYALSNPELFRNPKEFIEEFKENYLLTSGDRCLVGMGAVSLTLSRPVLNCDICRGITEVFITLHIIFLTFF